MCYFAMLITSTLRWLSSPYQVLSRVTVLSFDLLSTKITDECAPNSSVREPSRASNHFTELWLVMIYCLRPFALSAMRRTETDAAKNFCNNSSLPTSVPNE